MSTPAYWLPGLDSLQADEWTPPGADGNAGRLTMPALTTAEISAQAGQLKEVRAKYLVDRPLRDIMGVIDRVARRFEDRGDPLRRAAVELLPGITGYSREMTEHVLSRQAKDWHFDVLDRVVRAEFDSLAVADDWVDRQGFGRLHVVGPELIFHVFSGNVPGVAVTSLVRALLVKSASLAKTASGEPLLPALFARGVSEEDPGIGECLAVAYWKGGEQELESAAIVAANIVIGYGSEESMASLRERVPRPKPLLEYGNRLSFAVIARDVLRQGSITELVEAAAEAVATFDQQGCVSPHMIFVEGGGAATPREWTTMLARALERLEARLPAGVASAADAARIQQVRGEAEFSALGGSDHQVHTPESGVAWTAIYDPIAAFQPSCLNRTVRVMPVDDLMEVAGLFAGRGEVLQTAALAGPEDRLRPLALQLARHGVTRISRLKSMPWPAAWWHHDGRPPLGDLVRWCDWE